MNSALVIDRLVVLLIHQMRKIPYRQLFRFGMSSALMLGCKIGLTKLFTSRVDPYVAYSLTHVVVFIGSYYSHLWFTFKSTHSRKRFWQFFKAVLILKVIDFVLFGIFFESSGKELSLSVLLASLAVAFLRFSRMRQALEASSE